MTTYDGISQEAWLEELHKTDWWTQRHFMAFCAMYGMPESLLDVGCGTGSLVSLASILSINSFGIDQLIDESYPRQNYKHHNLTEYIRIGEFEIVWCIEVAEHLHESAHATLCDTLADNLAPHGFLVFSAAFPNQGGMGHVSERPSKYWQDQFSLRNLSHKKDMAVNLSLLWSNIGSPLYWLPANVLIFEK